MERNAAGAITSMFDPNCRVWLRIATVSGAFSVLANTSADEQVVPGPQELEDRERRDGRQADRQHDPAEHAELAGAVHAGRLQQLGGDAHEEVPQQEDAERQPERDVEEHHAEDLAEDPEIAVELGHRDQRHLDRHHEQRDHAHEDPVAPAEVDPGERVCGECGDHDHADGRRHGDQHRVPERLHDLRVVEHAAVGVEREPARRGRTRSTNP